MSRKHNTPHSRGRSRYRFRLASRGLKPWDVQMEDVETLRKRQRSQSVLGRWQSDSELSAAPSVPIPQVTMRRRP